MGRGGRARVAGPDWKLWEAQVKEDYSWHRNVSSGDNGSEQRDHSEVEPTGVFY